MGKAPYQPITCRAQRDCSSCGQQSCMRPASTSPATAENGRPPLPSVMSALNPPMRSESPSRRLRRHSCRLLKAALEGCRLLLRCRAASVESTALKYWEHADPGSQGRNHRYLKTHISNSAQSGQELITACHQLQVQGSWQNAVGHSLSRLQKIAVDSLRHSR